MKKHFLPLVLLLSISSFAESQVIIVEKSPRPAASRQRMRRNLPPFHPTLSLSIGYGYPNLDKNWLPEYYGAYMGSVSQQGVVNASLDYRFSRRTSIGVLVSHATVSAPYYYYASAAGVPDFTGKLDNWAVMVRLVHYIPVSLRVQPYFSGSFGFNSWDQTYTDAYGNKNAAAPVDLPDFAHQFAAGVKFNTSLHSSLFIEAGYGKYIGRAGLSLTF